MAKDVFENEAPKRKKKGSIWLKILIAVLVLVLLALSAVAVGVNYILGRLGRLEEVTPDDTGESTQMTDEFVTDASEEGDETRVTVDATDVTFESVDTMEGNVVNILLIGQDRRPGESRARSDTMIVLSLNKEKKTIQLTSFMRDTYVQIPGYLDNRLNAPYQYGGADLINDTLLLNFGLQIDGNLVVDFNSFSKIIDILGGVDIELTKAEANYLHGKEVYGVKAGMNRLNGEEALWYARIRYVGQGDYGRTERQRKVLISVANSLRNADFGTLLNLIDQVLPHINTNLSDSQIISYATDALSILTSGAKIESFRIPQDDAHYNASIRGMSVLVPDLDACREDLWEFIYAD